MVLLALRLRTPEHSSRWNALVTMVRIYRDPTILSHREAREHPPGSCLAGDRLPRTVCEQRVRTAPLFAAWWIVLSAALGLIFSLQMRILQTMSSETALLKKFPITFAELIGFCPYSCARSFVQWYGGAVILVLIGAVVAWRRKALELFPLVLFVAYVLLYAFHIRSYYEMQSGSTDSRTALRFSMSLMSCVVHSGGLGMAACSDGSGALVLGRTAKCSPIGSRYAPSQLF
jgi:hypothetical protein